MVDKHEHIRAAQVAAVSLTELETILLKQLCYDDYIQDSGWQSPDAVSWVKDMGRCIAHVELHQIPGVVASLSNKGLLWTDGATWGFTDLGRAVIKERRLYA